jgi:O-antigen/teichoic acid export membrane protein
MVRIARGATWSAVGVLVTQVLGVATSIVAARALPPEAFGVVGMAVVVTALLGAVQDGGMSPAIASGRVTNERTVFAAHWLLCGFAAIATVAVVALAPAVGAFFGNELVSSVLRVQVLSILCGAAIVVPQALLQQGGRFAALAALTTTRQVLVFGGVVVAVTLRAGVWTLVVPGVLVSAVMVPLYWTALGRLPPLVLRGARALALLKEGVQVSGSSLSSYFARNSDNVVIGRLNGEHALGLYAFAYNFLMQPLGLFSHALVPVLLPAFGRLEHGAPRSDGVVRVTAALARLGWPVMIGGALTAPLFVPLVFGDKWSEAVPLVQGMMVIGALQIPGPIFGTLALAIGDARFVLRWGFWVAVSAILAFLAGAAAAGPRGVVVAYLVYTVGLVWTMYLIARHRFGLPLTGLRVGLGRVARDVAVMTVAVLAAGVAARGLALGPLGTLLLEVASGAFAYVLAVRLLARDEMLLLLSLLPRRLAQGGARVLRVRLPIS